MSDLDEQIERMCADGRITVEDADEVRTFAAFLEAIAGTDRKTPEGRKRLAQAWREHYPDDYARALAEQGVRLALAQEAIK